MNQRQRKQVKTPNLTVQRTVLGVEDHVHAKALQRIEELTIDRDALFRMTQSDTNTIMSLKDKADGLAAKLADAKDLRFVKATVAWGVGFAAGTLCAFLKGVM